MTVRAKFVTSLLAGLLATGIAACDDTTEGNGDEMDGTGNSEMTEDMNDDDMEDDGTSGDDMNDEMNDEDEMEEDGG
ncbi:hypothetical protein H0B56_01880 [Haloechinothrix sp. YIM 98757]|uniref:DNA primase n=1 Tax=Haloechinothrix aidingensis TaxID=2752311 RepID=A0A838A653_9PSEU|nr:hypothetical protein [Haloechinothrix aidingensis]MBA0124285.1 hypothetical protein [Haloechinothrix aidingensis]